MNKKGLPSLVIGLFFVTISVWGILSSQNGLEVISLPTTAPPVTIITPSEAVPASRPTILIAHGFAGSSVLMRGFALTLAHAGFTTVSWDFSGHGTNSQPLDASSRPGQLLRDAESALTQAESTGLIDAQRIAVVGHSMGSSLAISYGIAHSETSATVAVSPVRQPVTNELPRNLLLMAGSLEAQFANNAIQVLSNAGGENSQFTSGVARKLVIVPNVEHISILFSPAAHKAARSWLDATFGVQPGATNYTDRRVLWFGLGIAGSILLTNTGLHLIAAPETQSAGRRLWRRLTAILGGGLAASLILWLAGLGGVPLNQILGLSVGGFLFVWFGLAGVMGLIFMRPHLSRPGTAEMLKGLMAFGGLWLGVGLIGNYIWLPWLLIPARLWLWVTGSIMLLPWFLACAKAVGQARLPGMVGWWLLQSLTVLLSLLLAITLNPSLGFLFLILPLVPVMIGIHHLLISPQHGSWAYAVSGAMFVAWLLLAVFPLQ